MSITISNCNEICSSPVNNSKSKMLYSFSKRQRFQKSKNMLCDKFYDSSFIQTSRSTTFGFGQKYDLSKTTRCSPPCTSYNMKSDFSPSQTQRKGFGFGKGRQQMKVTGPLVSAIKNKNPGPGSYQVPTTLQKTSYSFISKRQKIDKQKMKIPGPGHYPVVLSTSQKGQYPISKIKNVLVRNFSTTIGRKNLLENKGPAPGTYDISKASFSPDGKYSLSRMQNSFVRRFGTSLRSSLADKKETPGPGNYKLPSEFGHYVSKKFQNCLKQSTKKENKQNLPVV